MIAALARFTPELSDFAEAAARPAAVFRANYDQGPQFSIHHFSILTRFAGIYGLRGAALLDAGQSDLAYRDLQTLYRLQAALRPEPLLISFLVRRTLWHFFDQLLWEGLANHAWNPAQLQEIEALLERSDWRADYAHALRGERAFGRIYYAQLRASNDGPQRMEAQLQPWVEFPLGWKRLLKIVPGDAILGWNQARQEGVSQEILGWIENGTDKIDPRKIKELERAWERRRTTPYNLFVKEMLRFNPVFCSALRGDRRDRGSAHRLRDRALSFRAGPSPDESFGELVPAYLPELPVDPCRATARSVIWPRPEASYRLYSIGWNETDDGGKIALQSGRRHTAMSEKGDWVWRSAPR